MNEIQIKTFQYLTSGEGSTSERTSALELLTEQGFFGVAEVDDSIAELEQALDQWEEDETFCSAGINRFVDAVLPVQQKPVDTLYSATLHYTVAGGVDGHQKMAEIKATIQLLADVKDVQVFNLHSR